MDITHITSLLGGIALFLYGMSIMGAGLEKLAGGKMQGVLQKLTSSTIKGVIFGTLITGVIQSSAGTVVICVGLVNSGIMTLTQSVGVIMGANIGTTVTGQLIRMADISGDSLILTLIQPKTFAPVVAFIGCIFYVFIRNAKKKNIGQIMLGFGILFTGMSLMDTGVSPLRESAAFQELFVSMTNPVLGVLVGMVVTVIIQSSSASVGILQALSSTGLVTFGSAIPIILGAHIGTAFTPLLTIGGSSKDGKRAALIHLYFNIIGSFVLLGAIYAVRYTIGIPVWGDVMNKSTIANIHTLSSVAAMLLFLPCSGVLSKLAMMTVPSSAEEAQEEADFVLNQLGGRKLDLPITFDHEKDTTVNARGNNVDRDTLTEAALAFCQRIEQAGYRSMVYGNKVDIARMNLDSLGDRPVWFAEYNALQPSGQFDFVLWQYSNTGSVAGISTPVDMNLRFTDML